MGSIHGETEGTRVGALLCANDQEIHLIGYGVYEGDKPPIGDPDAEPVGWMVDARRKLIAEGRIKQEDWTNPKIRLDNGSVVWGCECWWGSEGKTKKAVEEFVSKGATIVQVDMNKVREEVRAENGKSGQS